MTLSISLDKSLELIPKQLHESVRLHWSKWCDAVADENPVVTQPQLDELLNSFAASKFIANGLCREPGLYQQIIEDAKVAEPLNADRLAERAVAELTPCDDEESLMIALRHLRRREMVRIAWFDINGHVNLNDVTYALSQLADSCVEIALSKIMQWQQPSFGTPMNSNGEPQQLVVLGMGKLGAFELNYSSDIDLIFCYSEEGETEGGHKQMTNHEFFVRVGQRLIKVLNTNNAYGFVFRVDMRLRPFGESGALASSFDAMESYYQVHGREWERYALIKARVIAGDHEAGKALMERIRPFIYRKYIDYGAFESLREMKGMISREVMNRGMDNNVKLGAGGIREVEFIGQAFQLIRGGREKALQITRILAVLETLRRFEMLPEFVVNKLTLAYCFLRTVEHRLQQYADEQTHLLPDDEQGQTRLAFTMGYDSWDHFEADLREHMERVHNHFHQVIAAPQTQHAETDSDDLFGIWQGSVAPELALETLQRLGYQDSAEIVRRFEQLRKSRTFQNMSKEANQRVNQLMPLLLGAVTQVENADQTLIRLLGLVEQIGRRSAYVSLLVENPMALSQLVKLCSASIWISDYVSKRPQLLDELLDPRTLYDPPSREEMRHEILERLSHIDIDDLETQMDELRTIKQSNLLRVAAADIMDAMPLMVVSDHLTELAIEILDACFDLAWRQMIKRHGRPECGDHRVCDTGFAVIAYGKLGGIELSYGSDLDVVFLHSHESEGRTTNGDKPLDNAVFYARLAQKVIHIMSTPTRAGVLYEIDTRLRPSGASGMMVSSIDAFADYQRKQAWTWEHQALVRARVVSGDSGIAEAFQSVRHEILCQQRDINTLKQDVSKMRIKMFEALSKGTEEKFDLKQDRGGIADIEFMVQYGVLAWANKYPSLTTYTDNIRLLDGLAECAILTEEDATMLKDAYRSFRASVHRMTLLGEKSVVSAEPFAQTREEVIRIWNQLIGE